MVPRHPLFSCDKSETVPILQISPTTTIDLKGLIGFGQSLGNTSQRAELINKWANDYFMFINARHNALSSGAGSEGGQQWRGLASSTVKKREWRASAKGQEKGYAQPKRGMTAVLTDTLQLLAATRRGGGPGQIRTINTEEFSATVGISGDVKYREPSPKQRKSPRGLGTLAAYHAADNRPIIVPPNQKTLEKMKTAAKIWVLKRHKP